MLERTGFQAGRHLRPYTHKAGHPSYPTIYASPEGEETAHKDFTEGAMIP